MTTRVLVANMGSEAFRAELQGRDHGGKIFQVDERTISQSGFQAFTIYRLQHVLVVGPATVQVMHDGPGTHDAVKLEKQVRGEGGQFAAGEEVMIAQGGLHVVRLEKGEQLMVLEQRG
jgi:hypothetical protein